ncbi:hypothetical protein CPB83DRAFT_849387 [Crepidotus variabilis]|uniref:Uncharacterized protein n=1 Tax=Crepidotus variabilis TaxID=179855 RepID=A0A9P6JRS0_9AGAR|nr:hypothetical protein CPB83DRAFT_849387 [Crepidotus variabilis]
MERAPIPQGQPPPYAFVTRVYRRNLRPIVLATTIMAGVWSLFSGIGFFRSVSIYHDNQEPKLATFALVLGILCMVVVAIEAFGIFAAATSRLPAVRAYAYLSMVVALIAAATGIIRIVVHYSLKNELLDACTNTTNGQTVVYSGWWGPIESDTLDRDDAAAFCKHYYDRDSWSVIVSFLIITFLAVFFSLIGLNFLRQVLDPSSPANVLREPRQRGPNPNYPSHYNGPYNGPYNPQSQYPYPPPNGPPYRGTDAFVPPYDAGGMPPGYNRDDAKDGYGFGGDRGSMYKGDVVDEDTRPGPPHESDVTSPRTGNPFR